LLQLAKLIERQLGKKAGAMSNMIQVLRHAALRCAVLCLCCASTPCCAVLRLLLAYVAMSCDALA